MPSAPAHAAAPSRPPPRPAAGPAVLRRCACGGQAGPSGECEECRAKRLGVQRRASSPAAPAFAPPLVHDVLRSPGRPLDAETRAELEPRFGHSFAGVRIHADGRAAESAAAVQAHAYTVGSDVVFGAGRYAPGSSDGRRLIAHELAHVVQQSSGGNAALQPRLEIGAVDAPEERAADAAAGAALSGRAAGVRATDGPVLRRVPGKDARDSFDAVVDDLRMDPPERAAAAREAVDRLLSTDAGTSLLNRLWTLLCGKGNCRSKVTVSFSDALDPTASEQGADASFGPSIAGARRYTITILNQTPPRRSVAGTRTLAGKQWGKGVLAVPFNATDPESAMARALAHELLHVWFINTPRDTPYPTGHADQDKGEIDPVFGAEMAALIGDIDRKEKELHAKPKDAPAAPAQQPAPPATTPADPRPAPAEPKEPSIVGGEVSLGFGGGYKAGATGILAADLFLGRVAAFHVGARGVLLGAGDLLLGGAVGVRFRQGDPATTDAPVYFDVDAGIVAPVAGDPATRLMENFGGLLSAGVGQEIGGGTHFVWRVGPYAVISDRKDTEGLQKFGVGGFGAVGVGF